MIIAAALIVALVSCVAAFSMPSLFGKQIVPQIMQQSALQLPAETITPEDVTAQAAEETFSVRVSGNVYFDQLPVQGAEVTIYLNGREAGKTTAGDIYMFEVPGVRMGDSIRVDATYEGFTGTASEVVKFKSMSLNVEIKTGRSFIRNALDMLPTQDDISVAEQQPAQQATQPQTTQPQTTTPASSPATTSSADANQLTSQVFGSTQNQLANMISGANNAVSNPAAMTDTGGADMNINDIQNTINAGGFPGIVS
jgi:hypothetical protein